MQKKLCITITLLCLVSFIGCQYLTRNEPISTITLLAPVVSNNYSVDEEAMIGLKGFATVSQEKGIAFVEDRVVNRYVQEVVAHLQSCLTEEYPHFPVSISVVSGLSDSISSGALSLPGGHIFLHLKTLSEMPSVDTLVGIIAHELGHIELRTSVRLETQRDVLNTYIDTNFNDLPKGGEALSSLDQQLDTYLRMLDVLFEDEADIFSVRLAMRCGYNPQGFIKFMSQNDLYTARYTLLFTHRPGDERAKLMETEFKRIQELALPHRRSSNEYLDRSFAAIRERAAELIKSE